MRVCAGILWVIVFIVGLAGVEGAGPPALNPTPASQPSTQPAADSDRIAALIRQLGAASFAEREAAQRELAAMGESVMAQLAPHVGSADPEIAQRVARLIQTPRDPAVRVELAYRLLETTDTAWMERAVYMLFDKPCETADLFIERAAGATGLLKVVCGPIVEQIRQSKLMEDRMLATIERIRAEKPDRAKQLKEMLVSGRIYDAEAAYWLAVEAMADHIEQQQGGAGQRSTSMPLPPSPTTRPGG